MCTLRDISLLQMCASNNNPPNMHAHKSEYSRKIYLPLFSGCQLEMVMISTQCAAEDPGCNFKTRRRSQSIPALLATSPVGDIKESTYIG